jgi:hypothetical protein
VVQPVMELSGKLAAETNKVMMVADYYYRL